MYKDIPNKYTYYFNPCSPWSCQSGSPAVAAVIIYDHQIYSFTIC